MSYFSEISLRSYLALTFSSVILATGLLSTIAGVWVIERSVNLQAVNKVRLDLNSARLILNHSIHGIEDRVEDAALDCYDSVVRASSLSILHCQRGSLAS